MPIVWVPSLMRDLTHSQEQVQVQGATVRQVIMNLEKLYPGFQNRLIKDDKLVPHVAVIIDGEETQMGLIERVEEHSEVFFLPAVSGG